MLEMYIFAFFIVTLVFDLLRFSRGRLKFCFHAAHQKYESFTGR